MLRDGTGYSIICSETTRCFQQAVDRDIDEAYACLGSLYADGLGATHDLEKAHAILAEAQDATMIMSKGSRDEP